MGFRFSQTSASTSSCASPSPSWSSASPALPLPTQSPKQLSALLKLLQSVSLKLELPGERHRSHRLLGLCLRRPFLPSILRIRSKFFIQIVYRNVIYFQPLNKSLLI